MPWRVRWTFVSWTNSFVGTSSFPTSPGRAAGRGDVTRLWYIHFLGRWVWFRNQCVLFMLPETCRIQNPDIPLGGWGRGARRSGWAWSRKIGCQQNYLPGEKIHRSFQGVAAACQPQVKRYFRSVSGLHKSFYVSLAHGCAKACDASKSLGVLVYVKFATWNQERLSFSCTCSNGISLFVPLDRCLSGILKPPGE